MLEKDQGKNGQKNASIMVPQLGNQNLIKNKEANEEIL